MIGNLPKITACSLWFIFLLFSAARAQTCSCAGAPLLEFQSGVPNQPGQIRLNLSYEYHNISNLYIGSKKQGNDDFTRYTHSALFEVSYGLTPKLTVSGLGSYIIKQRKATNSITTGGPGDGVVMLKYRLHRNTMSSQYDLAVGGGLKLPVGITDLNIERAQIQADMQPGTGSFDGVTWVYFSKTFLPTSTVNLYSTASYRYNGTAEQYNNNPISYKFGNTLISDVGISNKLNSLLQYTGQVRFRYSAKDRLDGSLAENTGGYWLSLVPGINLTLSESIVLRFNSRIPLYQNLNGTQSTTKFTSRFTLFYAL